MTSAHFSETQTQAHSDAQVASDLASLMSSLGRAQIGISKTTLWQFSVDGGRGTPEQLIYQTPPVSQATVSDRVLLVGTRDDLNSMMTSVLPELEKHHPGTAVDVCTETAGFWQAFFASEDFLDAPENITVPRALITAGNIQNYSRLDGETLHVEERLREIASGWRIPFVFVNTDPTGQKE